MLSIKNKLFQFAKLPTSLFQHFSPPLLSTKNSVMFFPFLLNYNNYPLVLKQMTVVNNSLESHDIIGSVMEADILPEAFPLGKDRLSGKRVALDPSFPPMNAQT